MVGARAPRDAPRPADGAPNGQAGSGNHRPLSPATMCSARLLVPVLLLGSLSAAPVAAQAPLEIVVNIASGRLDVFQGGERVKSYPVSVGLPAYATPSGSAEIRRMVWNPTWTPPPDAAWARDEKPAGPGWGNPMGRVKMHLFEDYFIHGTPRSNERRLGRPASHGCIRMRNADVMELARLVLAADGAPVAESTLRGLIDNPGRTREMALRGRVRVRIEYRVAEVDDYAVTLHPDVYRRAGGTWAERAQADLRAAGLSAEAARLPLALTRAPAQAVRIGRMDIDRPVRPIENLPTTVPPLVLRGGSPTLLAANVGAGQ